MNCPGQTTRKLLSWGSNPGLPDGEIGVLFPSYTSPLLNPHSADHLYTTSEGSDSLRTSEAARHAFLRDQRSLGGSTQGRESDALSSAHVPTSVTSRFISNPLLEGEG